MEEIAVAERDDIFDVVAGTFAEECMVAERGRRYRSTTVLHRQPVLLLVVEDSRWRSTVDLDIEVVGWSDSLGVDRRAAF